MWYGHFHGSTMGLRLAGTPFSSTFQNHSPPGRLSTITRQMYRQMSAAASRYFYSPDFWYSFTIPSTASACTHQTRVASSTPRSHSLSREWSR